MAEDDKSNDVKSDEENRDREKRSDNKTSDVTPHDRKSDIVQTGQPSHKDTAAANTENELEQPAALSTADTSAHANKPTEETSSDATARIENRLKYLETIARETVARLYLIETRLGLEHKDPWVKPEAAQPPQRSPQATTRDQSQVPPGPPPRPAAPPPLEKPPVSAPPRSAPPIKPPAPPMPSVAPPISQGRPPKQQQPAGQAPPPRITPPVAPPPVAPPPIQPPRTRVAPAAKSRPNLEVRIGGSWFNRIGVVAIILGVGFFFKYAYDNSWINKWGWVSIGIALGVAFILGGEKTRKKYASYAYGLTGCGISLLYLSIFAAFKLWGLVSQETAFVAMAAVTTTASLLAARYNALPIAVLGLIGGFLTPGLLSTHVDNETGLFGYITLLDAGVLALAYRKQWRSLNYLAFGGTVLTFIGWATEFYAPAKLGVTVAFLTIFFVIFALLAVLYNVINHRQTTWFDLILVFLNATLYFGTTYDLLEDQYHGVLGAFAIVVAAFYMILGYFTYKRDREDTLLVHTFLGLAFLFSVLAVPIQFDQQWVTIAWAVEGAVMTWVGLRAKDRVSRYAAMVVFFVAAAHWVRVDLHDFAYETGQSFTPIWNQRALSCAFLVAALAAATRLYGIYKDRLDDEERSMFTSIYILAANAAAILLLSLDANDYFHRALDSGRWGSEQFDIWNNTRQFTLSALWITYGIVMLIVGITRNQKVVRAISSVLLGASTLKVLIIDLAYHRAEWHRTLFNETFAVLAMLVLGLGFCAWLYSRSQISPAEKRIAMPVLIIAANLLALIALTTEPIGYFDRAISKAAGETIAELSNWMQFVLTVIWTVYAAVALAIGFRRRSKPVRSGALMLLGVATLKVLFIDSGYYDQPRHALLMNQTFGAFALVIGVMALGVMLYSRSTTVDDDENAIISPLLLGGANILAIIALSLEAIGYYKQAIDVASASSTPAGIPHLENSMHFALIAIWTIYAGVALVLGVMRNSKQTRIGALLLLAIAAGKVLIADSRFYAASWHMLVFNETFGAFVLVIGAMSLSVFYYSRGEKIEQNERALVTPALIAVANVYALIALSLEAYGHYEMLLDSPTLAPSAADDLRLAQQLSLSVIWTIYGGAMLIAGIWRRSLMLRVMALSLLGITIAKVFLLDMSSLAKIYRILSLMVLGAILLTVSYLYQRYRQRTSGAEADEAELHNTPEEAR